MEVLADERRTILFSSQNTLDVEQISDYITFIDRGKIIDSADKETFLEQWRRMRLEVPSGVATATSGALGDFLRAINAIRNLIRYARELIALPTKGAPMTSFPRWFVLLGLLFTAGSAFADSDEEGCKDHPLFNRMPNFNISRCEQREFDLIRFPTGAPDPNNENKTKPVEVEGKVTVLWYQLKESATAASGLQVMRNYQNAAKKYGGSIEGEYQGWCKGYYDSTASEGGTIPFGNGCTHWSTTLKFVKNGKEVWVYEQLEEDEGTAYAVVIAERQAMQQAIVANDWLDQINKGGWVEIEINFDTGKATIKTESAGTVAQMVQLLKTNATLKVEVGGHTDNVGDAASNLKLSEARAKSVMDALVKGGVAAARLTAKGYGQTVPVADNRREAGRAKNRRVELVKK